MKQKVIAISLILIIIFAFAASADSTLLIDWDDNGKTNSYLNSTLTATYNADGITITGQGNEVNVWGLDLTGLDYISFNVTAGDSNTTTIVPTVTVSSKEYTYTSTIETVAGVQTTYKLDFVDFMNNGETFEPSSSSAIRFKFQSSNYCDLTISDVYGGADEEPITTTTTTTTTTTIAATTTTTTGEGLTVDYIANAGFGVLDHILGFVSVLIPVAILIIGIFIGIKYAIDFFKGGTK